MIDMQTSDAERARAQGRRLRQLREHLGLSKGRLMDALGLTTTNGYDLYERGVSVIRLDRISEWAAAFGLSEQEFLDAVLEPSRVRTEPAADPPWNMRDALRSHLTEQQIDELVEEWHDVDELDQRAVVFDAIRVAEEIRAEAGAEMLARLQRRDRPA